jgi:hypothetical protein
MRCFLYILITWLGILVSVADASEVLLGVVVAVNRDQGRITLRVIDTSGSSNGPSPSESTVIAVDPDKIPSGLSKGDAVQVWGNYAGNAGMSSFRADTIRKRESAGSGSDPTGVRSRIGQGRGQGSGQGGGGRQSGKR